MSALPRTLCWLCGRQIPVRRNGDFRQHQDALGARCPNSGRDARGPNADFRPAR